MKDVLIYLEEFDDIWNNSQENLEGCNRLWSPQPDRFGAAEGIFLACLIKICIIDTHPSIFILFGYKDGIDEPI
jgi:hypothetical protein